MIARESMAVLGFCMYCNYRIRGEIGLIIVGFVSHSLLAARLTSLIRIRVIIIIKTCISFTTKGGM